MRYDSAFIDGAWTKAGGDGELDLVDPATEAAFATLSLADAGTADSAVSAARSAFDGLSLIHI